MDSIAQVSSYSYIVNVFYVKKLLFFLDFRFFFGFFRIFFCVRPNMIFESDWQGPPSQIDTPKSEFNQVPEVSVEIEVAFEHSFLHRIYSHASLRDVIYRLWQSRN